MNANVKFLHRSADIRRARLSGWDVDVVANRVQRDGVEIRLTPKAMAVLRELMQRRGTVVRRDDLLGIVWRDGFPSDDVLTHAITELRRALELDPRAPRIIETIPKVGYRLLGPLEVAAEPEPAPHLVAVEPAAPSASSMPLTDPRPPLRDDYPVWSPDGKQIAFLRFDGMESCAIQIVSALGGQTRKVAPCSARTIDYFDWSADGKSLLVARHRQLPDGTTVPATIHRFDIESGVASAIDYEPRPVGSDDLQPKSSPDGKWIAFRRGAVPYSELYVIPVAGGKALRVTSFGSRLRGYTWDNDSAHLIFSSDQAGRQALYRTALDGTGLEDLGAYEAHFPTLSRDAPVLVYMQESELMQLAQFAIVDGKAGARQPVVPSSRSDWFPSLSPSKARLAFVSMRTGSQQLWIHEFESGATFPVTHLDKVGVGFPQWSPDEGSVLFVTRGSGKSTLMRADVATARVRPLSQAGERVRFASYAKDGAWIYFSSDRGGSWQVWRMAPDGSAAEALSTSGGFDPRDWNGDGGIYYVKETSPGLFRLDLASREEKRVSWSAGYWNMDTLRVRNGELYFLDYNREGATWLMRAPLHPEGVAIMDHGSGASLSSTGAATKVMDASPFLELDVARPAAEASIAEDLSRAVLITVARDETDLMTARLPPAR